MVRPRADARVALSVRRFPNAAAAGVSVTRKQSFAIETVEATSGLSFHACAPGYLMDSLGLAREELYGAALTLARGSAHLYFNRVVGLGLGRAAARQQVTSIVDWYRSRGVHRFSLDLSPHARPRELPGWLTDGGFRPRGSGAKLFRNAAPVSAGGASFRVEDVGPERSLEWFRVISTTWSSMRSRGDWFRARVGWPGWRHYMAFDRNRPIAAASMFLHGERGRLCEAVTIPTHRRRGAQTALIARRLQDGLAAGARVFTSETAPPFPRMALVSYTNMVHAGFRLAYVRPSFVYDARGTA